jgi:hypothetical protein
LSGEWYFSVDLFILANKFKKRCLFFQSRSLVEPLATSRGTPVEKPCIDMVISEWWWIWKDLVGSGCGLIVKHFPGIHLEVLRKCYENLNQDSRSPGPRFETGTFRKQSRNVNHSTTTFGQHNCILRLLSLNCTTLFDRVSRPSSGGISYLNMTEYLCMQTLLR